MKCIHSESDIAGFLNRSSNPLPQRAGFTLIEVVLVLVIILIISGISIPYFAGSHRGTKLRTASRTISRMSRYGRSMAILREDTLTMVLNHETMEIYLGGTPQTSTNVADGELDQEVLKRLGYVEDDASNVENAGIEKEIDRYLPDGLSVREFKTDGTEEDNENEDLYLVHFYPNGHCDWFQLVLEDNRGMSVKMENDPVSGKIYTEFGQ